MAIIKPGKVVIVLQGRFAGRKAVVLRTYDEGSKEHPFPHAVVAGIRKYPLKVVKRMSPKERDHRSRIKPFLTIFNYTHVLPTRYAFEMENSRALGDKATLEPGKRKSARKAIRKSFETRYKAGKNPWFFAKLRF